MDNFIVKKQALLMVQHISLQSYFTHIDMAFYLRECN